MRAEKRGHDLDVALAAEPARRAQHAGFGFQIEPVARFDLDRGHALGDQAIEARQALR